MQCAASPIKVQGASFGMEGEFEKDEVVEEEEEEEEDEDEDEEEEEAEAPAFVFLAAATASAARRNSSGITQTRSNVLTFP